MTAARTFLCVVFLLLMRLVVSAQLKDTITLKNGIILYGELKSIQMGVAVFDPDDLSDNKIELYKIASIVTHKNYYRIETTSRDVYFSRIFKSDIKGNVLITDSTGYKDMPVQFITYLTRYRNTFWSRIDGNVSLGISYTRSSRIGILNSDLDATYTNKKFSLNLSGNLQVTQDSVSLKRDRTNLSLTGLYYFENSFFTLGLASYQRNLQLGLDIRLQEGVGIGWKAIQAMRSRLTSYTGLVFNQERSVEGESKLSIEVPLYVRFDFFKLQDPKITFYTVHTFYLSVTDKGRFRHDGQNVLDWEIIKDFYIDLTLYTNFDNKPVNTDAANFDYGFTFGLKYKF